MATITFKGQPTHTVGTLPKVGTRAPDFVLTRSDLRDVSLKDFAGERKLLNIVPSLDTGVCAASTRRFNQEAAQVPGAILLTISCDLPFAQTRFCEAEGIKNVIALSELRARRFGEDYGVRISDGPLAGLFSRAVVVLDEKDTVIYAEQVPEIAQEPDYAKALAALKP
jgi:thioredoxin-dependent peroxiredoxin